MSISPSIRPRRTPSHAPRRIAPAPRRPLPALLALVLALCGPIAARGQDLGLTLRPEPAQHGYVVTAVAPGSVAEAAGLRRGDVLVEAILDGPPVTLCPEEPTGPGNLRRALADPAAYLGRLRPGAPQHAYFQRVDIRQAAALVAAREPAPPPPAPPSPSSPHPRPAQADPGGPPIPPTPPTADRPTPTPSPADVRSAASAALPAVMKLKPAELLDPDLGDMPSHTLLVPDGWTLAGRPVWNFATPGNLVTLDVTVGGPAGEQVRFFPGEVYTFTDNEQIRQQMGARPGEPMPGGVVFQSPPESIEQHVLRDVLPRVRPAARSVRVVSSRPMPEVVRGYEEFMAPLFEQTRAMDAEWRRQGSGWASVAVDAGMVRVAYEEGGRGYEEDVFAVVLTSDCTLSGQGMMPDTRHVSWQRISGSGARAPAGALDAVLPAAMAVAQSVRSTPRWSAVVAEMQRQIVEANNKANAERLRQQREAFAKRAESLAEANHEAWKRRQASEDRMQRSLVNSIRGVDDFVRSDGTSVSLPDGYDKVYYSPTEGYLLTNSALLEPNVDLSVKNWEPVRRANP